jgi:DNA-binding CsgD family transcriptional regulator
MTEVLGRQRELQIVAGFLDSLTAGPAACVLAGEAGIGKTAVWGEGLAAARARSFRVLSCAPAEAEAALSYSSLTDLLAGVEPQVFAALPSPQRDALEAALLRCSSEVVVAGPRAVAMALVSVLGELGTHGPVLVAVDDVQWLDAASRRALEFAARRLEGLPVGFLLSVRGDAAAPLSLDRSPGARLERVRIGPLSAGAVHQLIKARLGGTFGRAELLRVHRVTAGNPFHALELASSLLREGRPAAGEPLPVPEDVRALVTRRLQRLPAATRELLLVAAAMPSPTVESLRLATRASAKQMHARLARAEAAGVVIARGESVRFRHPLFASAIYAACSQEERRRVHRRLAALATSAEQRARHLALCTERPDTAVAQTAAEAARDVRRRGAPEAAVELAELAVRLTPPAASAERDRRALELGQYLVEAGDPERARAVVAALADRPGPLRARALLDLAGLEYWGEGSLPAVARCEQALRAAAGDRAVQAACNAELAVYCDFDAERCERHARAALDLLDAAGDAADADTLVDALLATARASLLLGRGLPLDLVDRAFRSEARAADSLLRPRVGGQLGQWLKYVDDFAGARSRLEEALGEARQGGDESAVPNLLMHLAQVECWSGDWPLALRYAEESFELAEQVGRSFGDPPAMRALVDAHLGNVQRARATVESRLEGVEAKPMTLPLYLRARGFLDLSLGDTDAAVRHLTRAVELAESFGIREPGVYRVHADLIEALLGSGELDRAEALLDDFETRAHAGRLGWSLAASGRCRGLLLAARGSLEEAERSFEAALVEHERSPMPFERARTVLALGLLQRRRNQRRRAQQSLQQALQCFDELGAPLWAARARRELRPLGGRPTSRTTLTLSEQRVAELAASGLTNRQVAAALYISPKTVESALAQAYRKLNIHSRAELGAHVGAHAAPPPG